MKHPLHLLLELGAGLVPLALIGLPTDVAVALAACTVVQLLMQHSNADYRVGPLKYVLALNQGHRFHHRAAAGVGDVNFGLFTLVWDHLLGTFSYDAARRFGSEDLGITGRPRYPSRYKQQLLAPFQPQDHW
jgi:sterol desaturase/sphingolipid hydroxylase (fatty acid hydroxylase superfamily)